jgi:hypothetical protein
MNSMVICNNYHDYSISFFFQQNIEKNKTERIKTT